MGNRRQNRILLFYINELKEFCRADAILRPGRQRDLDRQGRFFVPVGAVLISLAGPVKGRFVKGPPDQLKGRRQAVRGETAGG